MIQINIDDFEFPDDVRRIQNILLKYGYDASLTESEALWTNFSEKRCAVWITLLEKDDDVYSDLRKYLPLKKEVHE